MELVDLRVANNSRRLQSVEEAIKQAEKGVEMLLDQLQDVLGQMASIVDHVSIPEEGEERPYQI